MSNQNRTRKILSWNVRGMNDNKKWPRIRNAIEESSCVAFCFQETKRSQIDSGFLKNVCPRRFNQFALFPSNGASGGLLTDGPAYTGHNIPGAPPTPHLSLGNIQSIEVGYYKMQLGAMSGEALQAPTNEDIDN
jgi:hypothetical protein